MTLSVPLVVYKDGERIVVGEASVVLGSGSDIVVDARISDDYIRTLLEPTPEFSMGAWAKRVEEVSCLDQPAQIPTDIRYSLGVESLDRNLLVSAEESETSDGSSRNQDEGGHESSDL